MPKLLRTIKFRLIACFLIILVLSLGSTFILVNYVIKAHQPAAFLIPPNLQTPDAILYFRDRIVQDQHELQQQVLTTSSVLLGVQIAIATFGSYFLIAQIIRPLEEINKLISEISDKMLYTQIQLQNGANTEEINELVTNFNAMIRRLDAAFSSQKQFVENVSHEIKTPLTVIKTNLESILYDDSMTKEEIATAIKRSVNSINFLNNLTEDLLLLSLVDKKAVKMETIPVIATTKQVINELQEVATKRHITIETQYPSEEVTISANPVLFSRAIANIVENAIKYSPEKTKVLLAVSADKTTVRITITDQGVGIPKEFQSKIFDRFYRVDKSRSRETGGTGLGLAITREVIELLHGTVTVESSEKGSTFTITLPR